MRLPGIPRDLDKPKDPGLTPVGLWLGRGNGALEIAVYSSPNQASKTSLTAAYRHRKGDRATPVLVVVESENTVGAVCALIGPVGEDPTFVLDVAPGHAAALCKAALEQPDRHAATRFLTGAMVSLGTAVPGLRNEGFLAYHELEMGVPQRPDWNGAIARGTDLLASRGRDLVRGLGYVVEDDVSGKHSILLTANRKVAIALYLNRGEEPELAAPRLSNSSPVSYALAVAERENLEYVMLTTPTAVRLYPSKAGAGVAQRGRTETYVELNLEVLDPSQAGYLWMLFAADATRSGGTLAEILDASARFRSSLGERLRERVYDRVVPWLSTAMAGSRHIGSPSVGELDTTYQMALHHLFRLLFIAYAEDKDLLPYATNEAYRTRSLKRKAQELLEARARKVEFGATPRLWNEVESLCAAIERGDTGIGVPAYDGGLFTTDSAVNAIGAELAKITLTDATYAPILEALLIDDTEDGNRGPVDFRSLGVREFGTIYEGLLESQLSYAESGLVTDPRTQVYRPARGKENPTVPRGTYYLASTSGARKATGSFYTKDFAVQHLLMQALEPALADHLRRLEALTDPGEAAASFFDFHVADISMGSGHFLVAAIDHIEARFSAYLVTHDLPGIRAELQRLREASERALGGLDTSEIEDARLLRRQIARRCIYGVDLKPAAVELARVSIWIHTFVPGLPLSLLDLHLVVGNSLTGIGTVEEADRLLSGRRLVGPKPGNRTKAGSSGKPVAQLTVFTTSARELMHQAADAMLEVARLGDATLSEVKQARQEWERAKIAAGSWVALLDILAAGRLDEDIARQAERIYAEWAEDPSTILTDKTSRQARDILRDMNPCHFPAVFPEVFFVRERPGFDVIVGNPPWEEATVEEDKFWARIAPGLAGLPQGEQETRKATLRKERPDLLAQYELAVRSTELTR
ncbi:MAG: Eco57I restriction-modification methylase domain-containing protein, partial [Thermoplasmata archaeon]